MIVRTVEREREGDRHVVGNGWESTRLIVAKDGMGYSLHHTVLPAGGEVHCHYLHHFESNYCIGGSGEVEDLATGEIHPLRVGSLYALDEHDDHVLRAGDDGLQLVCVFSPALVGDEVHAADGSYAAGGSPAAG